MIFHEIALTEHNLLNPQSKGEVQAMNNPDTEIWAERS